MRFWERGARGPAGPHRCRGARPPARLDQPPARRRWRRRSPRRSPIAGWPACRSAPAPGTPRGSPRAAPRCGSTSCSTIARPWPEALARDRGRASPSCARLLAAGDADGLRALPHRRAAVPRGTGPMIVAGTVRVPGDKSITHRALLLAALARGTSHVGGALTSLDARSSARVLRQLGAEISPLRPGSVVACGGAARFRRPEATLDCGNSGTTTRLLLGLLAGAPVRARRSPAMASLRRRPMRRVTGPLARMGARFDESAGDGLPLTIRGGPLVRAPLRAARIERTDQERAAARRPRRRGRGRAAGAARPLAGSHRADAARVRLSRGGDRWLDPLRAHGAGSQPFELQVPGTRPRPRSSSGAATLAEAGELRDRGRGRQPDAHRVPRRAGADGRRRSRSRTSSEHFGEPVGDLVARPAPLRATEVAAGRDSRPDRRDPAAGRARVACARATTVFREVGELRVKESDRLGLIAENLRSVGCRAEVVGRRSSRGRQRPAAARPRPDRRRPPPRDGLHRARHRSRARGSGWTTWRARPSAFRGSPKRCAPSPERLRT